MNYEKKYEIDENSPQHVIDERNNSYLLLAKYKWFGKGDFKLGIRKFYSTSDGEIGGKGFEFLTEDGPHTLAQTLLSEGYGDAVEIVDMCMEKRKDIAGAFVEKINNITDNTVIDELLEHYHETIDSDDEDMYDPEDLLE